MAPGLGHQKKFVEPNGWIHYLSYDLAIFAVFFGIAVFAGPIFGGLGSTEWATIAAFSVLLFGKSLPKAGRWLGRKLVGRM